jgi:hypothetical protein
MEVGRKAKAPTGAEQAEQLESEIRVSALGVYTDRRAQNCDGDALSDWLKAEKSVRAKYGNRL